jgi:hypothetical protein
VNASTSSGDVKTGISGPIRLSDFHPVACETLVRLGNQNDGGYVIPLNAVTAANALLSFGLSATCRSGL